MERDRLLSGRLSRRHVVSLATLTVLVGVTGAVPGCERLPLPARDQDGADTFEPPPAPLSEAARAVETQVARDFNVIQVLTGATGAGGPLQNPYGVAIGADGNVFVADTAARRIAKFDASGRLVASFGSTGESPLEAPIDLAIGPGGYVFVLDRATGLIQTFTPDGEFVGKFGGSGFGFYNPFGLAASADAIFVADTGTGRVVKYGPMGEVLLELAMRDSGDGGAKEPSDVLVEDDGTIVVADGGEARLLFYGADGAFQSAIDMVALGGVRAARLPDGTYLVSDGYRGQLLRWSRDGTAVGKYGQPGSGDGMFDLPTGLAVDPAGNVYVADTQNARVQKISLGA